MYLLHHQIQIACTVKKMFACLQAKGSIQKNNFISSRKKIRVFCFSYCLSTTLCPTSKSKSSKINAHMQREHYPIYSSSYCFSRRCKYHECVMFTYLCHVVNVCQKHCSLKRFSKLVLHSRILWVNVFYITSCTHECCIRTIVFHSLFLSSQTMVEKKNELSFSSKHDLYSSDNEFSFSFSILLAFYTESICRLYQSM